MDVSWIIDLDYADLGITFFFCLRHPSHARPVGTPGMLEIRESVEVRLVGPRPLTVWGMRIFVYTRAEI